MKKEAVPNVCLRQARYQRNWTQRRLADELGVEEQTVRSWERGIRVPSLDMRHRLCQLFETTPEQLGLQPPGRELPASPEPSEVTSFSGEAVPLSLSQVRESRHENVFSLAESLSPSVIKSRDDNRHRMVQRVRSRWITGVLEHSLSPGMLITLGLQEQPDAVANPWHNAVQETDLPPRPLPAGTRITQVYDDAGGELLILGEPGAGKTTLLLVLARDLLERAEGDETVPIPVIFTLSSWTERPFSLATWLIEELHRKYQVPRQLAEAWVMLADAASQKASTRHESGLRKRAQRDSNPRHSVPKSSMRALWLLWRVECVFHFVQTLGITGFRLRRFFALFSCSFFHSSIALL